MTDGVQIRVEGLKELDARLAELGAVAGRRALNSALRSSLKPMVNAARAAARGDDSGALSASIEAITARPPSGRDTAALVLVGPRKKSSLALFVHNSFYKRKRKGIFYGHLVEFGHRIGTHRGRLARASRALTEKGLARWHARKSGGRIAGQASGGTVAQRPFLRPAFTAQSRPFIELFRKNLERTVKRIENRRGKKTADPKVAITP